MKISVIGYAGSGKSSFATKLGIHYNIETTYLDKLHFEPGWVERDKETRNTMIKTILKNDKWIIDGSYTSAVIERFEQADQIFFFNFNRLKCLYGALVRKIKYRNKPRRSMTEGNKEKFDFKFMVWILFDGRTKKKREFYRNLVKLYSDKVIVFKNRRQVNCYLKSLGINDFKVKS